MGNPPWLFLSGRGSPARALEKSGRLDEARALARTYEARAARFARSSEGCRDLYKWFIEASLDLAGPGGVVGMIVPNTWLTLPRYADVRRLLLGSGLSSIVDLGFGVFRGLNVPSAIFISGLAGGLLYADLKGLRKQSLTEESLDAAVRSSRRRLSANGGDFGFRPTALAKRLSALRGFVRGDQLFKVSEGEHALRVEREEVSEESGPGTFPFILDWTAGRFAPPRLAFLPSARCLKFSAALHAGPRVILRKTGDQLVSSVCPVRGLAVAHQNVYVVKSLDARLCVHALQALLGSKLLTYLYRTGPLGQPGRMHAQLRIKGLYALLFPRPENFRAELKEIEGISESLHEEKTVGAWARLNRIVYEMYGLTRKEIAEVEARTADVILR
ncbi:MAG: BREX-1 system adenine-specific DNA-methyltransferase PglX [Acidobacteria bacterium]|nr:BREX-1 system adenine-specific DNA-methyltransferase PglX [Acidobacteriota bacterium]